MKHMSRAHARPAALLYRFASIELNVIIGRRHLWLVVYRAWWCFKILFYFFQRWKVYFYPRLLLKNKSLNSIKFTFLYFCTVNILCWINSVLMPMERIWSMHLEFEPKEIILKINPLKVCSSNRLLAYLHPEGCFISDIR